MLQFFASDYGAMTRDAAGYVLDAETQLPPHIRSERCAPDATHTRRVLPMIRGSREAATACHLGVFMHGWCVWTGCCDARRRGTLTARALCITHNP